MRQKPGEHCVVGHSYCEVPFNYIVIIYEITGEGDSVSINQQNLQVLTTEM